MLKDLFKFTKDKSNWVENILDNPNSKIGNFLDWFILSLVLLFPFALIFESLWNNAINYHIPLFVFEAFISIVFALEYIYRFIKARKKISFFINPMRIIDLLSFLPFFLGFIAWWEFLVVLRILRVLRVLRLVKRIPLTAWFIKALNNYKDEYLAVFTLYIVILFLGSFFVYFAERWVIGTTFTNIAQALWWWLVTTATVGYGDMAPVTSLWKIIWSFLVFLWPVLWWLISAVTIMVFMETSRNHDLIHSRKLRQCVKCKSINPKEANYCMKCWEELQKPWIISEIIGKNL